MPSAAAPALTVDAARDKLLRAISPTTAHLDIEVSKSCGHIAATDLVAKRNIPVFVNSAMDGYAFRRKDAGRQPPAKLTVTGKSLAGSPFDGELGANCAVRVTTGAMIPASADCVVIQENVEIDGSTITLNHLPDAGQHLRHPGDDIRKGELLIARNSRIKAADTGLLAAQGYTHIPVFRPVNVGVFSTGDELRLADHELLAGQIYDSNRATLINMLKQTGAVVSDLGIVADNPDALQRVLDNTAGLDCVVSSGGVSVGEADYVKRALQERGELLFWKIAMKPGKPLVTAKLHNGSWFFGLPGNPVSGMVTCAQFVIPAIKAFSGISYRAIPRFRAITETALSKEIGRFEFQRGAYRVTEDGQLLVNSTGLQDSHVLSSMTRANCFICLEQHSAGAVAGSAVEIELFDTIDGLR